ncbi:MAG: hypothetical protein KF802_09260 [Bdellovibrionaceae bacterium]|nr:hypothetical protein [Pseudobdellovibrionaceae bacterium]MBX3033696.1 hypothetical protein [Pseudobdellovibrionaceae bacterium]
MIATRAGLILLGATLLFPLSTERLRFIQLTTPLSVSAEKSHPPYIAFAEAERRADLDEWDLMDRHQSKKLGTDMAEVTPDSAMTLAGDQVLRLETVKITKAEVAAAEALAPSDPEPRAEQGPAVAQLPPHQEEWPQQASTWSEQARQLLSENATKIALQAAANDRAEAASRILLGSGTDENGNIIHKGLDQARVEIHDRANHDLEISGDFRLSGIGYAGETANGHRFEVVRRQEGISQERGEVDVRNNSYRIRVQGRGGDVVVLLKDAQNHLIGEASFRLSNFAMNQGQVRGPELVLIDREDVAGSAVPAYAGLAQNKSIAGLSGTAFSGATGVQTSRNGDFELGNVHRGSFTLLAMTAKDHEKTLTLVPAGFRAKVPLFPKSMITSLKQIVSEQRNMNLNDPAAPVIWGRAELNGKPLAGVRVEAESAGGLNAVYFNQFMIPDASLSATSENGLYSFVGLAPGFHALLARRGEGYFAHQNVVTERGSVSVADLSSKLKTDQVIFRVYDAFTAEPRPARLAHQGVEEELEIPATGVTRVLLPEEHRLSLVNVAPDAPYMPATYTTDDSASYAHFPLIRGDWLNAIRAHMRLDDDPMASTVIGFVPDQGFTAEAVNPGDRARVLYFDSQGRPSAKGEAGGGFVIFGMAPGAREITVFGESTGRVFTRVIAADSQALNVLLFKAD